MPGAKPVTVAVVPPGRPTGSQLNAYGSVPPPGVIVIDPLLAPLHLALFTTAVAVNTGA